ncbi:MAG: hypothetical protein IJW14_02835 [Oscillospiraceae bacterium]|nr:hypothetical protein [Oscillospiraceae bacterium]
MCTTYDATVYALILALQSGDEAPPALPCERFGKTNLKYFEDDAFGMKLARLSLISFGEKIHDDQLDNNNLKSRLIPAPLMKAIRASCKAEPEMAKDSRAGTDRINQLQDANSPLPEIFRAYGDMAVRSFSQFQELTAQSEELIRAVSEWNFLVDMVCDYGEDYKNGTYNGFKREGLPTFSEYFDKHYVEFSAIANSISDRFVQALWAVQEDSVVWNTLFKICIHALDTVLTSAILGEDVSFHYFKDLFERIGKNRQMERDIKRLGISKP